MKRSFFILFSSQLDYPLYVAFNGSRSVREVLEHHVVWDVVHHLTRLDCKAFFVEKCTKKAFDNSLIKIDLTFN